MGWTREENNTIQEMIKRIRGLEQDVVTLQDEVKVLTLSLTNLQNEENVADWTNKQWTDLLTPFIKRIASRIPVKQHDHRTDQAGGPCFAIEGAALLPDINTTDVTTPTTP